MLEWSPRKGHTPAEAFLQDILGKAYACASRCEPFALRMQIRHTEGYDLDLIRNFCSILKQAKKDGVSYKLPSGRVAKYPFVISEATLALTHVNVCDVILECILQNFAFDLEVFKLGDGGLSSLDGIERAVNLKEVHIGVNIHRDILRRLKNATKLEKLRLQRPDLISELCMGSYVAAWPNLKELELIQFPTAQMVMFLDQLVGLRMTRVEFGRKYDSCIEGHLAARLCRIVPLLQVERLIIDQCPALYPVYLKHETMQACVTHSVITMVKKAQFNMLIFSGSKLGKADGDHSIQLRIFRMMCGVQNGSIRL